MPYAVGSTLVRNCHNGALSPLSRSSDCDRCGGRRERLQVRRLDEEEARAITKMHTETLLTTTGVGDPLGLTDSMHGNESEDGQDQNRSKIDGRVLTKERR
jgi:hypothetical protein